MCFFFKSKVSFIYKLLENIVMEFVSLLKATMANYVVKKDECFDRSFKLILRPKKFPERIQKFQNFNSTKEIFDAK